jgi:Zn-dependent protease with chaperone function
MGAERRALDRRHFMLGLGLGVGSCALCAARPSLASVLPTDIEALMGPDYKPQDTDEKGIWQSCERIEDSIKNSNRLLRAPELQKYTVGVVERLLGRPAPELRIYLVHEASFNAAMFPTGMMLVHTGFMVRARNEAQFAAVLGHEAGHYFRKHTLQQYRSVRRKAAAGAVISVLGGIAAGAGGGTYDSSWVDVANGINMALVLSIFNYSREMETEADAFGIQLMSKSGYDAGAASQVWKQLIEERRQSAKERNKAYRDRSDSIASTHPPSVERMKALSDTAKHLQAAMPAAAFDGRAEWQAVIAPYLPALLDEQIKRNDPGASLYLIQSLAQDGWTGLLRYQEGETYRMRGRSDDASFAAASYAEAVKYPDAPPEAWRAHGYALLKAGHTAEAHEALNRYLTLVPNASDAGMVRFTLSQ